MQAAGEMSDGEIKGYVKLHQVTLDIMDSGFSCGVTAANTRRHTNDTQQDPSTPLPQTLSASPWNWLSQGHPPCTSPEGHNLWHPQPHAPLKAHRVVDVHHRARARVHQHIVQVPGWGVGGTVIWVEGQGASGGAQIQRTNKESESHGTRHGIMTNRQPPCQTPVKQTPQCDTWLATLTPWHGPTSLSLPQNPAPHLSPRPMRYPVQEAAAMECV